MNKIKIKRKTDWLIDLTNFMQNHIIRWCNDWPIPYQHQFCIPFMLYYHHTKYHPKRKSGSRDIQIWKRPNHISGDLGHFWPFLAIFGQIRILPKNLIRPLFTPYIPLTSCKIRKNKWRNFEKNPKNLIFGPFLAVFGHFWPNSNFHKKSSWEKRQRPYFRPFLDPFCPKDPKIRIFPKNRAPSVLYPYGTLTSCKKLEKTNEPILRKVCHWRTDGQTDGLTEAIL